MIPATSISATLLSAKEMASLELTYPRSIVLFARPASIIDLLEGVVILTGKPNFCVNILPNIFSSSRWACKFLFGFKAILILETVKFASSNKDLSGSCEHEIINRIPERRK